MPTYNSGWTAQDMLRSIYDNSNARFEMSYDQWLPQGIAANRERLASYGITDPANQLNMPVPDALPGSLIPSGPDALGMLLAIAPIALSVGGFAGVGGLSNAGFGAAGASAGSSAASGAAGALAGTGEAVSGAYGATAGELANAAASYGGAAGGAGSTIGGLMQNIPPGSGTALQALTQGGGDASWGVNQAAGAAASDPASAAAAMGGAAGEAGGGLSAAQAAGLTGAAAVGAAGAGSAGTWLPGLSNWQTLGLGASALGSLIQGGAAYLGAGKQADAANRATDAQMAMFNTLNQQGAPYRAAGYSALGTMMSPDNQTYFQHQFGPEDLQKGLAPGYEFMRDQNLRAAKNVFNAQTGLVSGNTAKGVLEASTNYALNAGYQPSFNNYQAQQTNIFNRLSAIAGLGQTANAQSAQAGAAISPGIAQSTQNAGTALGGGIVGAGNAAAGGLNNAASWYSLPQILAMGRGP